MNAFYTAFSTKTKTNNNNNNIHANTSPARHTVIVPARMLPMLLLLLLCHLALVVLPSSEATLELSTAALLQQAYEKEAGSFLKTAGDVAHHEKHAFDAYKFPNQPAAASNDVDADVGVGADADAEPEYVDAAEQRPDVDTQLAHLKEKQLLHKQPPKQPQPVHHCFIEFTSKIPGICQRVKPIGNACISGEYMDMFNEGCM